MDPKGPGMSGDNPFIPAKESEFDAEKALEEIKEKYKVVIEKREKTYMDDINAVEGEERGPREAMHGGMEMHNNIVTRAGLEIMDKMKGLNKEDRVAAIIGILLHDVGKVASGFDIKDHHNTGEVRAKKIMKDLIDQKFEGVIITKEIAEKVVDSGVRHMNHPYLVNQINGGKRFPEVETVVDKIVFEADMIANLGFKNFGFRLNETNIAEDLEALANREDITSYSDAVFNNIFFDKDGAVDTVEVIKTKEGKEIGQRVLDNVLNLHKKLKEWASRIEAELARDAGLSEFDVRKVLKVEKVGATGIKAKYNEYIKKAGEELEIKVDDFLM